MTITSDDLVQVDIAYTRAQQGAALLDERKPGWDHHVDPDALDINNTTQCVLGQVYGDGTTIPRWTRDGYMSPEVWLEWNDGLTREQAEEPVCASGYAVGTYVLKLDDPAAYGFDAGFAGDRYVGYAHLDRAWQRLLAERAETRKAAQR